jgi:hypothetical protein
MPARSSTGRATWYHTMLTPGGAAAGTGTGAGTGAGSCLDFGGAAAAAGGGSWAPHSSPSLSLPELAAAPPPGGGRGLIRLERGADSAAGGGGDGSGFSTAAAAAGCGLMRPEPRGVESSFAPIDAPCTHCLRHGDPMRAQKQLTTGGGGGRAAVVRVLARRHPPRQRRVRGVEALERRLEQPDRVLPLPHPHLRNPRCAGCSKAGVHRQNITRGCRTRCIAALRGPPPLCHPHCAAPPCPTPQRPRAGALASSQNACRDGAEGRQRAGQQQPLGAGGGWLPSRTACWARDPSISARCRDTAPRCKPPVRSRRRRDSSRLAFVEHISGCHTHTHTDPQPTALNTVAPARAAHAKAVQERTKGTAHAPRVRGGGA